MHLSCRFIASKRMVKRRNPMMFSYCTFCYEPKTWMNVALNKVGKLPFRRWSRSPATSGPFLAAIGAGLPWVHPLFGQLVGTRKSHDTAQAKSRNDRGSVGYLLDIDIWQSGTTRIMQDGIVVKGLAPKLDPSRNHLNPRTDLNELEKGTCRGALSKTSLGSSNGSIMKVKHIQAITTLLIQTSQPSQSLLQAWCIQLCILQLFEILQMSLVYQMFKTVNVEKK